MIKRNRENPTAQLLAALVSTHIDEVYQLIHCNRRVATMWHRMSGPAVMRSALVASDPGRPGGAIIPARVSGNRVAEPLGRLLSLLSRYGSQRLRDDVAIYGPLMIALPGSTLSDLWKQSFVASVKETAVEDGFANWNA